MSAEISRKYHQSKKDQIDHAHAFETKASFLQFDFGSISLAAACYLIGQVSIVQKKILVKFQANLWFQLSTTYLFR